MFKKKNLLVVLSSSVIIILVAFSVAMGYIIHLQWRHLEFMSKYYEDRIALDTLYYAKKIRIVDMAPELQGSGSPYVKGQITNKGERAIGSLLVRVNLLDRRGSPVYGFDIYPLSQNSRIRHIIDRLHIRHLNMFPGQEIPIRPFESVTFKASLYGCPDKFIEMLKAGSFPDGTGEWSGKVGYEIMQLRLM